MHGARMATTIHTTPIDSGIAPQLGDASKEMNNSATLARTLFGELLSKENALER
jgi:hypothetical protein